MRAIAAVNTSLALVTSGLPAIAPRSRPAAKLFRRGTPRVATGGGGCAALLLLLLLLVLFWCRAATLPIDRRPLCFAKHNPLRHNKSGWKKQLLTLVWVELETERFAPSRAAVSAVTPRHRIVAVIANISN
jgi:hypothetical protein